MRRRIYLDYNAGAPLDGRVRAAMEPVLGKKPGNASSIHAFGREARVLLEEARAHLGALLGAADKDEVVFASGGTEADNLAVLGVALARADQGRHAITSAVEHPAVLAASAALEKAGFTVTALRVDGEGRLDPAELRRAIRPDTVLVSLMHANNETGVLFDLPALAGVAHAAGVPVHTDAVQSFGKVPVRVPDLGVDLLSLSGHKIGGPAGSGALYVRSGVRLAPRLLGGSQERERRAGTENLAAAVGLAAAAELAVAEREAEAARLCALRDTLEARVQERIPGVAVNGGGPPRLPQTSNLAFPGVEAEELLVALDLAGFACSAGAACSSGALEPSHVLRAMGLPPERVRGSIRVSLGRATTAEEVDALAEALPALVARCRG